MRTSQQGIEMIASFEGFSSKVYLDIAGLPTIGYGHLIKKGESFTNITKEEALDLLAVDLLYAERSVKRLINRKLNQNQFDSLVSFTYNLGGGALQRSTLRQYVNDYNDYAAYEQFKKYCFAGGKKSKGLYNRRVREAQLYAW